MFALGLSQTLKSSGSTTTTEQKLLTLSILLPGRISDIILLHTFCLYLIVIQMIKLSWVPFCWGSFMKAVSAS